MILIIINHSFIHWFQVLLKLMILYEHSLMVSGIAI